MAGAERRQSRGHKFARYADDFIVMVKSKNAAKRVMTSLIRYCEERLQLVVNRAKSRAAPLKSCEFLGYRLNNRAKLAWTEKARIRFKERVRQITSRNRGHRVKDVIDELNLFVRGWLNYYKLSSTYSEVKDLSEWVRRRVRLYLPPAISAALRFWKQWKQPRTRRRNLLALGVNPKRVHMASRSRKGYWRMSQVEYRGAGWTGANATCPEGVRAVRRRASNCAIRAEQPLVRGTRSSGPECPWRDSAFEKQRSLTAWTEHSGVKAIWIVLHYGPKARV